MALKIIISLNAEQKSELSALLRSARRNSQLWKRIRIIQLSSKGDSTIDISRTLHLTPCVIGKWRRRFNEHGIPGLYDAHKRGRPQRVPEMEQRILSLLNNPANHMTAQMAATLARRQFHRKISPYKIWRTAQKHGIILERDRLPYDVSDAPGIGDTRLAGIYVSPPEYCLVIATGGKGAASMRSIVNMPGCSSVSDPVAALSCIQGTRHPVRLKQPAQSLLEFLAGVATANTGTGLLAMIVPSPQHSGRSARYALLARHANIRLEACRNLREWLQLAGHWLRMLGIG